MEYQLDIWNNLKYWLAGDSLNDSYNEIVINKEYRSFSVVLMIYWETVDLLMINQSVEIKEDSADASKPYKI